MIRRRILRTGLRMLGMPAVRAEAETPDRVSRAEPRMVITISVRDPGGSLANGEFNDLADAIIFLGTAVNGQP